MARFASKEESTRYDVVTDHETTERVNVTISTVNNLSNQFQKFMNNYQLDYEHQREFLFIHDSVRMLCRNSE